MRLPVSAASPAQRTSTGTIAFSGAAPRRGAARSAQRARAGGQHRVVDGDAVAPADRAQVVERARHALEVARRRARPVEQGAARRRAAPCGERARAAGAAGTAAAAAGELASFSGASASAAPSSARSATAWAKPLARVGAGRRVQPSARARCPRTARGRAAARPSSATAMPSTMQWWALPTMAIRPSGSSSASHISHSGRSRESGAEKTSSTSLVERRRRPVQDVLGGSKSSSSTHTGSWTASGTSASSGGSAAHARAARRWVARSSNAGRGPFSAGRSRDPADVHRGGGPLDREKRRVEG